MHRVNVALVGVVPSAFWLIRAAEAGVAGAAVGRAGAAGGITVAEAVGLVAKVRTAADDAAGTLSRSRRIVLWRYGVISRAKPVAAPLPDVADRVVQAKSVGLKGVHRRGSVIAVFAGVLTREPALPYVAAVNAAGGQLIAPGVALQRQPAAGCVLPLRLPGQ